ncbi:MAG: hypothetical protein JWM28_1278, partial [Chitinophagaceae bacterium]|nr:hypothetical protein [Chitinophagaceae bacterium]
MLDDFRNPFNLEKEKWHRFFITGFMKKHFILFLAMVFLVRHINAQVKYPYPV